MIKLLHFDEKILIFQSLGLEIVNFLEFIPLKSENIQIQPILHS